MKRMCPIPTSLIVCACVFGGALLGMFLRRVLPEDHLNADSKSTVNLGIGLIGTMSGIALGLLVASEAGKYDTQKNELTKLSADFVLLDRVLAHYGSETKESRDLHWWHRSPFARSILAGRTFTTCRSEATDFSRVDNRTPNPATPGGEALSPDYVNKPYSNSNS